MNNLYLFLYFFAYHLATSGVPPVVRVPPVENRCCRLHVGLHLRPIRRASSSIVRDCLSASSRVCDCRGLPSLYPINMTWSIDSERPCHLSAGDEDPLAGTRVGPLLSPYCIRLILLIIE